jgi:hypothetical protein
MRLKRRRAAEFFKGKTTRPVVGSSTGGYDTYARMLVKRRASL